MNSPSFLRWMERQSVTDSQSQCDNVIWYMWTESVSELRWISLKFWNKRIFSDLYLWLVYYIKEHTFNSLCLCLTVDFWLDQQEPACAFCLPRVDFDIALRIDKRVPTPETHTLILWSTYFVFGKWKVPVWGSRRVFFCPSNITLCQTPKLWSDSINKR